MTDKEFDENLNNITRKMTPDEALDESRRVTGLDPSLTPVSPAPLDHTYGTKNRKAPGSVTVSLPGEKPFEAVEGQKDVTRTQYGGKVRVVDQKTGAVSWEDLEGNAIEAPASERMRAELGANVGNIDPWKLVADRQSQEDMMRSMRIAQSKVDANNAALSTRRERKMRQQLKVTDNLQQAAANMQSNLAVIQAHIASGGDISESGARTDDGGKTWWVEGIVAPSQLRAFNNEMLELGGRDALKHIMVRQQVDRNGNPLRDKDGNEIEPRFAAVYVKDGNIGDGIGVYTKELSLRQALRSTVKAYEDKFKNHDAAVNYAAGVFGVSDPAKYGLTLHGGGKPASVAAAEVRAKSAAEVADKNNASREEIAKGKNKTALEVADKNNAAKLEATKMTNEQRAKIEAAKAQYAKDKDAAKLTTTLMTATGGVVNDRLFPDERVKEIVAEITGGGASQPTAQTSSGDNTKSDTIQEFNPKGRYKAGDKFSRNGVVYEVGSDGQPHRVK
jgi:hypothetical protein